MSTSVERNQTYLNLVFSNGIILKLVRIILLSLVRIKFKGILKPKLSGKDMLENMPGVSSRDVILGWYTSGCEEFNGRETM
jgi:hypothetical protein